MILARRQKLLLEMSFLAFSILLFVPQTALCQKVDPDSLKTAVIEESDSLTAQVPDTNLAEQAEPVIVYLRAEPHRDSLLRLLPLRSTAALSWFDFPQMSARFDYDPLLVRVAQGPWGEGEQLYPLGLPPTSISRADPLFGDASLSNPVPTPQSEEGLRIDPSSDYYLLSPALAGALVPFSRATALYQGLPDPPGDSAHSKLYMRRGRFAFANTQVEFANHLGNLGSFNLDLNIVKLENPFQLLDTKNDRFRLLVAPKAGANRDLQVGLFFNRTHADRPFLPGFYLFEGRVTDNYLGGAVSWEETITDRRALGLLLRYRNDEQTFESGQLYHKQRSRIFEGGTYYQAESGRHSLRLEADGKLVNYESGAVSEVPLHWRLAASDLVQLRPRVTLFLQLGAVGASGLDLQPTATGLLHYKLSPNTHAALVVSRQALLPQPEQRYLPEITADLALGTEDYLISGDPDLPSGNSTSLEFLGAISLRRLKINLRAGLTRFKDAPFWENDRSVNTLAGYQPLTLDRSLAFASASMRLRLPHGGFLSGAYAIRQVYDEGVNYTFGAEHEADGFAGFRFWVERFQITVTAAIGGKYRSQTIRYLDGSGDQEKFAAESFLSFDLKRFHFFWNYTNLFDQDLTINGRLQPGRSHWWGFSWEFFD